MIHLHLHSYFSMMWGTAPIDAVARRLRDEGQTVFPLTDRNTLHGLVEHLRVCAAHDLRPIIGCDIVTADQQALALVKTQQGYQNLCRMLTAKYRDPRWSLSEALYDHHEGLIFITQNDELIAKHFPHAELYVDLHPGGLAKALDLHKRTRCPMVVTCHAYMLSPKAWPLHQMLRAIDTNSKLSRIPAEQLMPAEAYLFTRQELQARFAAYPEALKATEAIAEACTFAPIPGKPIFPPTLGDQGFHTLRDKTYAGLHRRYPKVTEQIRRRADYELDMIRRKQFANCFLVIEDVVSKFPLTCGRGSAAASIISYALGITHVDPIAHNLFFERFLNPGREDPPDIDIDFAWDERDRVRDYLWARYGRSHIAMVCNHNRLRPRSALREVAKVYGLGANEIEDVVFSLVKSRRNPNKLPPNLSAPWPHILRFAKRLEDYPRHISVHCGGVVITPDEITNHCPLQPMPIGYDVIPWEKDGAEEYGFVKLDFLGNRSLAVIRDTLAAVEENYKVPIRYPDFNPIGDPNAQARITQGDTIGCFYVESPATRQLLQKTGMGDFETLVAISSIIRPAANQIASEWVRRHRWVKLHGRKPNWKVIHPLLEETLAETHGLMVYQEDVTRTAMALAGFDATQGDKLRKIISKKDKVEQLRDYQTRFYEGCRKKGLDDPAIKEVWDMVLSFSGYSFCKPHSASYALVSFKSAFLKYHYPAEFLAAVISNQGGFYSCFAYLSHARRIGIQVLGPDINQSRIAWYGFQGRIRMGFSRIKGLHQESMAAIIAARHEPFQSFEDFLYRTPITLEETKRLILAGCFDELEKESNRPSLNWRALYWYARHQNQSEDLFPDYIQRKDLPTMEAYSENTCLQIEQKLFGFWLSRHPLERYRRTLQTVPRIKASDLGRCKNHKVTLAGILITGKTVLTKHEEPMSFLTFEDETDLYETVMFPELFKSCGQLLDYQHAYLLTGEVVSEHDALCINLEQLQRL